MNGAFQQARQTFRNGIIRMHAPDQSISPIHRHGNDDIALPFPQTLPMQFPQPPGQAGDQQLPGRGFALPAQFPQKIGVHPQADNAREGKPASRAMTAPPRGMHKRPHGRAADLAGRGRLRRHFLHAGITECGEPTLACRITVDKRAVARAANSRRYKIQGRFKGNRGNPPTEPTNIGKGRHIQTAVVAIGSHIGTRGKISVRWKNNMGGFASTPSPPRRLPLSQTATGGNLLG